MRFVAAINTPMYGVPYTQGQLVDVSAWTRKQILQFLDKGLIAPADVSGAALADALATVNLEDLGNVNDGATTGQILIKQSDGSWAPSAIPAATMVDATTTVKGAVKLAGDLGGTAALPTVPGLAGKEATGVAASLLATHVAAADPHPAYALDSDLAAHAAAADPHPVYTTAAEMTTAFGVHTAAADPHPVYALDSDLTAHAAAADPHPVYLTQTEGDTRYAQTSSELNDWDLSTPPTNGQIPKWDNAAGRWKPAADATGGGGSSALSTMTDVDVSAAAVDGQVLKWDTAASKWKRGTDATSSGGGTFSAWIKRLDLPLTSLTNWSSSTGTWTTDSVGIHQTVTSAQTNRLRYTALRLPQNTAVLECEIRIDNDAGGSNANAGLVLRTGPTNVVGGTRVDLRTNGTGSIQRIGTEVDEQTNAGYYNLDAPIASGVWVKLRLESSDGAIAVYINNVLLTNTAISNAANLGPYIALVAYSCAASWRNLKAWSLANPIETAVGGGSAAIEGRSRIKTTGATITASSYYAGLSAQGETYQPSQAFASSSTACWAAGTGTAAFPYWLQIQYPVAHIVTEYIIKARSGTAPNVQQTPSAWELRGSNDGTTWTTLDTRTNQLEWGAGQAERYEVATLGSYLYYRLHITNNDGVGYVAVGQWDLFEAPNVSPAGILLLEIGASVPSGTPAGFVVFQKGTGTNVGAAKGWWDGTALQPLA